MNVEDYRRLLSSVYGDRAWILAMDVLAGMRGMVETLEELGATKCLCIAGARGTGELPNAEFAPDPIVLDISAPTVMEAVRQAMRAFGDLSESHRAQVDTFDPSKEARVIANIFDDGSPVASRDKWGARPQAWQDLEDKTTIDALWDELGVPRAPAHVVDCNFDALWKAAQAVDAGDGSVWVGDNTEGFHGGGEFLRWIRNVEHAKQAAEFLGRHCATARVMPFLEGIPCSVHGLVFPQDVLVLRPCEMIVLRKPDSLRLHYARAGTFWDPRPDDREALRALARRVGEHLRERVGYRGAFTLDGVMTRDGFIPTELNPRYGAALGVLNDHLKSLPLLLLNFAVVEGVDIDWKPRELERLILEAADAHRAAHAAALLKVHITETRKGKIVFDAATQLYRWALDDEPFDAEVMVGPAMHGGWLNIDIVSERRSVGKSVAPFVADTLMFVDREWDLGIGRLEPAPDVRADVVTDR